MGRNKDRFDFAGADDRVGQWLHTNGRVVIPVIALLVVGFFVLTRFV
ncbi:hypothetical protein CHO01_22020 [Cellulomonas hominis]|uniref:Uncharacterized protein n=1 Tax=Cellulomonas hominis TaxID=156981 RepID=A0A511FCV9_9CELL|nr:hypothetical protein [Cellulomonas hominis]MBB5474673.1 hypothetical protein [Cellulomonas hominis]NKY05847.1 hypothetical protein [Cellulomonas hominis]GEL47086.1 hypothetical protein CHO01_22020 [Cellulomonas hominis]